MSESSTSGQGADRGWANSRAAATGEAGGWAWVVSGHNGEDLIRAEGPMAAVAWHAPRSGRGVRGRGKRAAEILDGPLTRVPTEARIEEDPTHLPERDHHAALPLGGTGGRDTMISLEGLTLTTGRSAEAGYILRTFAHYVQDGLIPNMFPEGQKQGLYHTADATLWFFHAIDRYVETTDDRATLHALTLRLIDIVDHHLKGTQFGIGVDTRDGLLCQGAEGYQLTWMDAKVGDWVVTPRRGKAVEVNALWYNALKLMEGWVGETRGDAAARPYARHAEQARQSFNARFWYDEGGYLYDVVDGVNGDDPACRPNQLFAISLRHPVLDPARWEAVVEVARKRLLTPVGLRSLAPGHPDFKARYFGDLRARDAAYHQGTVWAWLIGSFIDAWLKVHPNDHAGARRFLEGFVPHLSEGGLGTISEIFDAEPPYTPRGCIAQAWSVAEVLRCWMKTSG